MAQLLHPSFSNFTFNSVKLKSIRGSRTQKTNSKSFCCVLTEDNRTSVVKNGNDMLDICRVVNGMWQTSGGWGKIDINNAVNFMLHYVDAGLTTFDMADICKYLVFYIFLCSYLLVCYSFFFFFFHIVTLVLVYLRNNEMSDACLLGIYCSESITILL